MLKNKEEKHEMTLEVQQLKADIEKRHLMDELEKITETKTKLMAKNIAPLDNGKAADDRMASAGEEERILAEKLREKAENERIKGELKRVSSSMKMIEEEQARMKAELSRVAVEEERTKSEKKASDKRLQEMLMWQEQMETWKKEANYRMEQEVARAAIEKRASDAETTKMEMQLQDIQEAHKRLRDQSESILETGHLVREKQVEELENQSHELQERIEKCKPVMSVLYPMDKHPFQAASAEKPALGRGGTTSGEE